MKKKKKDGRGRPKLPEEDFKRNRTIRISLKRERALIKKHSAKLQKAIQILLDKDEAEDE